MKKLKAAVLASGVLALALPASGEVFGCERGAASGNTCFAGGDPEANCMWCYDQINCTDITKGSCGDALCGTMILDVNNALCINLS